MTGKNPPNKFCLKESVIFLFIRSFTCSLFQEQCLYEKKVNRKEQKPNNRHSFFHVLLILFYFRTIYLTFSIDISVEKNIEEIRKLILSGYR
jgi:hypothetical protein